MHERRHCARHRLIGGVFGSRWSCAVVAGAIIGLAGVRGAIAGEPAATPVKPLPAANLAAPQSPGPLRGERRLDPSKFGARAASGPSVSVESIQDACGAIDRNRYAQLLHAIEDKEDLCATASYSIEEQRTAGCIGADTVHQCQLKPYSYCMDRGGDRAAFRNAANRELTAVRRVRDMLEAHVRYIENTYALHSGELAAGSSLPRLPRVETLPIR